MAQGKHRESPAEPFKRVLGLAVRAIAGDDEVQVSYAPGKPEIDGKSVQLGFSMNLNGGGYGNYSRTRQAQHNATAARERLERSSRDTERQARDAYQGVISEIARVQALQQAVESSRTSLQATEAGYEVGTRTLVDVLDSRRLLIQAETNYSAAKYSYLNNLIQLRLAAGDLDRSVLEQINQWLTVPPAPPAQ